jgi:hypothetical protein
MAVAASFMLIYHVPAVKDVQMFLWPHKHSLSFCICKGNAQHFSYFLITKGVSFTLPYALHHSGTVIVFIHAQKNSAVSFMLNMLFGT